MAVGAYIPPEEQRPTIDLDFTLLWGGTTEEFRSLMKPMIQDLRLSGYDLDVQKGDKTYDISVQSPAKNDALLIQHHRRNKGNFEKNRKSLEREVANQRVIAKDGVSFAVMSPEDLILHKLSRLFTFSNVYNLTIPTRMKTENMMRTIRLFRKSYHLDNIKESDNALIRMYHDAHDIKHLSMHAGLNKRYFEEAAKDWNKKYMNEESAKALLEKMGVELK
ncbi:MAG TPA: hypothetical protein VJ438_03380 [Candidatus Nanoarchaeia archaeon]|nr:hypothetical protein [Candidatus Nanoarchaeia archaeon]